MREREPFVSGLPDSFRVQPNSMGMALLAAARALACDEAEALSDRCADRKINYETIPADPVAIAQRQAYDAIVLVLDEVLRDADLTRRLAALLGGGMPRDRYPSARR